MALHTDQSDARPRHGRARLAVDDASLDRAGADLWWRLGTIACRLLRRLGASGRGAQDDSGGKNESAHFHHEDIRRQFGPLRGGQRDPSAQTLECLRAYRAAIEDYRAKRTDGAVAALSSLDHEQLTLIARRLEMIRSSQQRTSDKTDALFAWGRQMLLAAGMLHVDAALTAERPADFTFHALLAGSLLGIADAPALGHAPGSAERRTVLAIDSLEAGGSTSLTDAAFAALALREGVDGRMLVLLFTDGLDTSSWLDPLAVSSSPATAAICGRSS